MTYQELKNEVLALGFLDTLENEEHLLFAANRALRLMANDFSREGSLALYREYRAPLRSEECVGADGVAIREGEGVAFCYRLCDGEVRFGKEAIPLSESGIYRMRASCDALLMPVGDAVVFQLCVYAPDVPLALCESALPFVSYPIDKYTADALRVRRVPTDAYGAEITEGRIEGRVVMIPRTFSGAFFIHYDKKASPIAVGDGRIDVPEECLALFPLLVCGYLWLDDEPDRAQYYMALYREGRSLLLERKPSRTQRLNTDTLGWT